MRLHTHTTSLLSESETVKRDQVIYFIEFGLVLRYHNYPACAPAMCTIVYENGLKFVKQCAIFSECLLKRMKLTMPDGQHLFLNDSGWSKSENNENARKKKSHEKTLCSVIFENVCQILWQVQQRLDNDGYCCTASWNESSISSGNVLFVNSKRSPLLTQLNWAYVCVAHLHVFIYVGAYVCVCVCV